MAGRQGVEEFLQNFSDYLSTYEIKNTGFMIRLIYPIKLDEEITPNLIRSHIDDICMRYPGRFKLKIFATYVLINQDPNGEEDAYKFFYGSHNTSILRRPFLLIGGMNMNYDLIMQELQKAHDFNYQSPDAEMLAEKSKDRWIAVIVALDYVLYRI